MKKKKQKYQRVVKKDVKDVSDIPPHESISEQRRKTLEESIPAQMVYFKKEEEPATKCLAAVRARNFVEIEAYIKAFGTAIYDKYGETPLFEAEDEEMVKFLVELGINVNHQNKRFETCLYPAARGRNLHLIRSLVKYGAEIDKPTASQTTPLLVAVAREGCLETVRLLLELGANVNAYDAGYSDRTSFALHHAVYGEYAIEERHDLIRLLHQYGARLDIVNWVNRTPLEAALWRNDIGTVHLLLNLGGAEYRKSNIATVIREVSGSDRLSAKDLESVLRRKDVEINLQGECGVTALFDAIVNVDKEKTTLLLAAGADVHAPYDWDLTVLNYAVRTLDVELVKILLDHGARINDTAKSEVLYENLGKYLAVGPSASVRRRLTVVNPEDQQREIVKLFLDYGMLVTMSKKQDIETRYMLKDIAWNRTPEGLYKIAKSISNAIRLPSCLGEQPKIYSPPTVSPTEANPLKSNQRSWRAREKGEKGGEKISSEFPPL